MIGTVGCGRDVTREKAIENNLERQRLLLKKFFENAPVMFWAVDKQWKIREVSQNFLETAGCEKNHVLGRSMNIFFKNSQGADVCKQLESNLLADGRIESRHLRLVKSDGKTWDVLVNMVADIDEDGRFTGALGFALPVGGNLRIQAASRRLARSLEQARRMQTISTLAGGVAHQFNNALAVILGNLEMLEASEVVSDKLKKYTVPIFQASQRLTQLTSQLLAYARGGKYKSQLVETRQLLLDTLRLVRHTLGPHIKLELDFDDEVAAVRVDIAQIQELLASIFANAAEALGGRGKVVVGLRDVHLRKEDTAGYEGLRPGNYVKLTVQDDGPGMDEETRQRVFEPFFTTKFQGRGLGMAAAYGIVKQHNGWIGVEASSGKGTRVIIYLPMVQDALQKSTLQSSTPDGKEHRLEGAVMIVEDEELVMEVDCAIVEKLGYPVIQATTGEEALRRLQAFNDKIAFVLLDVVLPDMDGSHLYPLLKKYRPDLKVIVCSGYGMDGPAKNILDAGAEGFIQKPFSVFQLKQVIDKI